MIDTCVSLCMTHVQVDYRMAVANVPEAVNTQYGGYGGYDNDFVETVPDRYVCSTVCTKVLRDPHLTSCCGQHFCETCLNYWFEKHRQKSCPHCRAKGSGFNHFLDKKLKREISELKIWCSNKDKGCKWRDELQNLEKHIKSDDGCSYVEVKCPQAISFIKCPKLLRKDLDEHIRNTCKYRSGTCIHCNEKLRHFYLLLFHHRHCEQYPCPCPNKCGTGNMPRKDVSTHRNECPLEPVECTFAEAGCKIKLVRNQLDKHLTDNQQTHLIQLMTEYKKLKKVQKETVKTLEETKRAQTITTGRLESMQEGISRELQKAKVTRDLEPVLKSIQTKLGSSQNKINDEGIEHGLQFSIPAESYFEDNKKWYSPTFYVRDFKTCVQVRYIPHSGLLEWALVVLGTERGRCGEILQGHIEDSLIEFNLPCVNNPSEMYMHNVLKRDCGKIKSKLQPLILTVYISEMSDTSCDTCNGFILVKFASKP